MDGFVAVTDPGWYRALAQTPGPKDANFWRPSPRASRLAVGTPFFFKLRAPANAIAGYGLFAGFSVLPDWLAWDTFGPANGVADLATLRDRLRRIQQGARIEAQPEGRIGCCLIAEAVFFPEDAWVKPPADFRVRTQTGARIDLTRGEGLRIWNECRERAPSSAVVREEEAPQFGAPQWVAPRLGQSIFRVQVLDAYRRACAVTGEHSLPVLDAAHIRPFAAGGAHAVSNGISLRTDLHRLFDRGYVSFDPDLRLVVSRRLRDDYDNGKAYYAIEGQALAVPAVGGLAPSAQALTWHRSNVFLG